MKNEIVEKWMPIMLYTDKNTVAVDPENYEACASELEKTEKNSKNL